mgnify:CR=1 FL=1
MPFLIRESIRGIYGDRELSILNVLFLFALECFIAGSKTLQTSSYTN